MKEVFHKNLPFLCIGLAFVLVFGLLPYIHAKIAVGEEVWRGVPVRYVPDSTYYFAQMKEVAEGFIMAGNPYIKEYRNEIPPAFFIPVDIVALPLILGASWSVAIVFNWILYGAAFLFLVNILFRRFGLPNSIAFISSVLVYLIAYGFLMRPVSLQIVFSFFVIFLLALYLWLTGESNSRLRGTFLAVAIALSAYVYTYMAIIVAMTSFSLWAFYLLSRGYRRLRHLTYIGIGSCLLVLPFIFTTLIPQLSNPWYQETLVRIGLVETRYLPIEAWYQGRWVVIGAIAILIFFLTIKNRKETFKAHQNVTLFFMMSGIGLLLATISNTFTGKELTTAIHVGRFIFVWTGLLFTTLLYILIRERMYISLRNMTILGFLLLLLSVGILREIPRSLGFINDPNIDRMVEVQSYAEPMKVLNGLGKIGDVVWADNDISEYIPILSKDYALFSSRSVLQIMPSSEIFDRYSASHFISIDRVGIEGDLFDYLGAGYAEEQPGSFNLSVTYCERLHLSSQCQSHLNAIEFQGTTFFDKLEERYAFVRAHQRVFLERFNVKYLLLDTKRGESVPTIDGVAFKPLWSNDRYQIFTLAFR